MKEHVFLYTIVSIVIFTVAVFIKTKKRDENGLSPSITTQLKGLGFCMVLFAHIGYGLFNNTNFLFPLSIWGGIGANLFLFLSGFGLAIQAGKNNESSISFYKKRFEKIYMPLWIATATLVFILWIGGIHVSIPELLPSLTGIIPSADLYADFNSPLWFITLILIFYAAFPFLYSAKKRLQTIILWMSFAVILYYGIPLLPFPEAIRVLYVTHIFAFPLGVFASMVYRSKHAESYIRRLLCGIPSKITRLIPYAGFMLVWYLALHARIGTVYEQPISLIAVLILIASVTALTRTSSFLSFVGKYSYELYIIHWPLLRWFPLLYVFIPPWLATCVYLGIFLILSMGIQTIKGRIYKIHETIHDREKMQKM